MTMTVPFMVVVGRVFETGFAVLLKRPPAWPPVPLALQRGAVTGYG